MTMEELVPSPARLRSPRCGHFGIVVPGFPPRSTVTELGPGRWTTLLGPVSGGTVVVFFDAAESPPAALGGQLDHGVALFLAAGAGVPSYVGHLSARRPSAALDVPAPLRSAPGAVLHLAREPFAAIDRLEIARAGGAAEVRLVPSLPRPAVEALLADHARGAAVHRRAWETNCGLATELLAALRAGAAIHAEEADTCRRIVATGECLNFRGKLDSLRYSVRQEARGALGALLAPPPRRHSDDAAPATAEVTAADSTASDDASAGRGAFAVVLSCLEEDDARKRHAARAAASLEELWAGHEHMLAMMALCT